MNPSCFNGFTTETRLETTFVDSAKKDDSVDKDQSLLTMKNLPDLLEETSQDFVMSQTQKEIFEIANQIQASDCVGDKEIIKDVIYFSKDMQREMESIISKLQSQIYNLISEYKVLKSKNVLLEHKVKTMKIENCCKQCKKKKVYRDNKCAKIFELEAPGEGQLIASLPSPPRLDPQLLAKISSILSQSENFLKPIEQSLTTLQMRMQKYEINNDYETNQLSLTSEYENESDNSLSSTNFYSI